MSETDLEPLRREAAFVRALLDELDNLAPSSRIDPRAVTSQLAEELASLGARLLEASERLAPSATRSGPGLASRAVVEDDGAPSIHAA
jgi:hypothetical protein